VALTAVSDAPAVVFTDRLDIVGTNPLGQALLAPMFDDAGPIWPGSCSWTKRPRRLSIPNGIGSPMGTSPTACARRRHETRATEHCSG
jgi:hypothetical protein